VLKYYWLLLRLCCLIAIIYLRICFSARSRLIEGGAFMYLIFHQKLLSINYIPGSRSSSINDPSGGINSHLCYSQQCVFFISVPIFLKLLPWLPLLKISVCFCGSLEYFQTFLMKLSYVQRLSDVCPSLFFKPCKF
jgi:hypothetical protein